MEAKKCAHDPCTCAARDGSKYCSETCEMAGQMTHLRCNCGHPACR